MKNLIVQYYISDDPIPEWAEISIELFKRYAKKHGVEYQFTGKLEYCNNHYFENLKIVYKDEYLKYDKILYVDVDVIPENMEENIFDLDIKDVALAPEYHLLGMDSPPLFSLPGYVRMYAQCAQMFDLPNVKPKTVKSPYLMMNSGVIVWTKKGREKARQLFMNWEKWYNTLKDKNRLICLDQPFINGQVIKHLDYTELKLKWNHYPRFRFYPGRAPNDINFIHYTGGKKKLIKELHGDLI
jgi:lipopolysaccharide biosynthesis glycosyltransferase